MKLRSEHESWAAPGPQPELVELAPLPAARGEESPRTNGTGKAAEPVVRPALAEAMPPLALTALVEAVLFVADAPVEVADLARALEASRPALEQSLAELATRCDGSRGVRLQRAGGRVQLVSAPEAAAAIERFLGLEHTTRLSRAALDALSIIAYRQPVTRPEIDVLRGVDSDAVMRTLLARGLVEVVGRRETVGHPVEYGTTFLFLEYFGLTGLGDLPPIELVDASALPEAIEEADPVGLPDGR
jgi:segregation and condensation protein B